MIALAKSLQRELGLSDPANRWLFLPLWMHMTDVLSEEVKAKEKKIPLRRGGTPEDVANIATFLASTCLYVSGQVIQVDGGMNMC